MPNFFKTFYVPFSCEINFVSITITYHVLWVTLYFVSVSQNIPVSVSVSILVNEYNTGCKWRDDEKILHWRKEVGRGLLYHFYLGAKRPDCRVLHGSVADIEQMGGTGCRHCNQLLRPQTNRRSTDKSHTNRLRLDGIEGTTASMLGYSCFAAGLSIIMQLQCVEVQWLSSLCIHMPVSVSVTSSPSCTAEHWRTMPSALDRPTDRATHVPWLLCVCLSAKNNDAIPTFCRLTAAVLTSTKLMMRVDSLWRMC